ncbi:hypothetical protein ATE47_09880 [Chryseobacterium sp. IHB B 17019]|uniref:hypothetical protein n=1 Tax=Chryseobacterium sp. IHB B 17019 TaxID=1721091 RepID=UPI00071FD2E7|nr:hypothetical protein [Chryseobacterium sp. IHB B 17019]ALR30816.1 hypothetical protein ATE47_09880 [Chryseobacterium sp. IHB B 17019]
MKTKLGLIGLLMIFNIFIVNGQTLSKEVRNDFCINAKYNYFYGANSFFGLMNLTLKRIGISDPYKMDEAVKNICNNESLQNSFFESVHNISRGLDKQQYLSMGMKYSNVEKLTDYIISKNNLKKQIDLPKNPVFEDDLVNESNVINKKQLLQSIYPKSILLNDSTVLRKEIFDAIGGRDKEIEFKTTIAKEYSYTDEKKEEDRVKIILYSTNEKEIVFFDILIMLDLGEKGYQSIENMSFLHRRLYLDKSKRNINEFKTVKENGRTFFVINYTDENNKRKSDFYTIDLKLIKTLMKNEDVKTDSNSSKRSETKEFPVFTYNKLIDKYDYEDGESMSSQIVKEYEFLYGVVKKVINNNGDNNYKIHIIKTTKEFDDLHSDMPSFVNKDIIVNLEPDDLYNKSGKIKDGWKGRFDLSFDDYKKLKSLLVEGRKIKFSYVEGGAGSLGTATSGLFFFNYIEEID